MRIGILGTGTLATALGKAWSNHDILIAGRDPAKAAAAATLIGPTAHPTSPAEAVANRDAVLIAVPWQALHPTLTAAGAPEGSLSNTPLIDPTNPVAHGTGTLLTPDNRSIAEHITTWSPGTHVVKAFNLVPATQWTTPHPSPPLVPLAGDDEHALQVTTELVRAAGGLPAVLGPLPRARQLEEVAGFVISLAFSGHNPNAAIPTVNTGR